MSATARRMASLFWTTKWRRLEEQRWNQYESLTAFESYKARRKDYEGPYAEYKANDPYYKGVFDHSRMKMEFWNDVDRDLWIE